MFIHTIQTGTVAIKERQRHGSGHGMLRRLRTFIDTTWTAPLPIYAWVIEHPEGVIVVDTGETARTSEPGYFPRWHPYFRLGVRAAVRPEEEIGPQLRAIGIEPDDVRWVVMTHLHTDHAGGLHHFPRSEILVSHTEQDLAAGFRGQVRGYLTHRFPAWFAPRLIAFEPTPVGPFLASMPLTQAGDVLIVPTPGHTPGHVSVLVHEGTRVVFLAGDTSYTEATMLDQAIDGIAPNEQEACRTLGQIQALARAVPTVYLPSHDPQSGSRLAARQAVYPDVRAAAVPLADGVGDRRANQHGVHRTVEHG